ncbi:MAG: hypothetical protein ACXWNK_08100 [Vulcanimicrobiaceae bacterium]
MKYNSDDELDRALFALPLEEPPEDLRASILAATVYRPALDATPFKLWEAWALGAVIAVVVWLCILIGGGAADSLIAWLKPLGETAVSTIIQPMTLLWIALGGAAAFWLSQLNFISTPVPQRFARR